jgi:hypothetical protein
MTKLLALEPSGTPTRRREPASPSGVREIPDSPLGMRLGRVSPVFAFEGVTIKRLRPEGPR